MEAMVTILAVHTNVCRGYNKIKNNARKTKSINTPIAFIM